MPEPDASPEKPSVAIFNASEDTVEMLRDLLQLRGYEASTGKLDDVKRGSMDFVQFIEDHNPQVLIVDIAPPYDRNWAFFRLLSRTDIFRERQVVLTTTNKARLDEIVGFETGAFEIVGKPYDLNAIVAAVGRALETRRAMIADAKRVILDSRARIERHRERREG